ncbi:plastid transcriptionally active 16 [Tasmannia lanceolata]|uniref:plastid transcriptionally active 16 n=1 Tax=Tasmannia lanceolata TaxID=3420 RepID=UPI004063E64C
MASILTSNSILHTTPPLSKRAFKNPKPSLIVYAKRVSSSGDDENQSNESSKPNRFFFDFGKIPDVNSLVPVVSQPSSALSFANPRRKDPQTVFVAGASGLSGIRIAQTLLRQGFSVRAGVPEIGAAQELARLAVAYKIISSQESKRLNAVESTFQDPESIAKAIGNAGKVVVTIGPSENGPTSEVTTTDALQVIQAAQLAGVSHVAVIYENGFISGNSTYNVLGGITSFFSNLFSRSQPLTLTEFLAKVVETDVRYTLIKASLTEDFSTEYSTNVVVLPEGNSAVYDYKVSKSQIASLIADVFSNTSIAENKVVEVSTDPSAPSKPMNELFSAIPEDGRRKAYAESVAQAKAEEEALRASEKAREAADATQKLEVEVKKLSDQEALASSLAKEARERAEAAGTSLESLLSKAKGLREGFSWDKFSSQITTAVSQKTDEKPKAEIATVRGQAKARTLPSLKAVIKQPVSKPKPKPKQTPPAEPKPKPEVRKVFGGLFTQETIYINDD